MGAEGAHLPSEVEFKAACQVSDELYGREQRLSIVSKC